MCQQQTTHLDRVADSRPDRLTKRTAIIIILGLAIGCWLVIIGIMKALL